MFECFNVWIVQFGCSNVWMFECINALMYDVLDCIILFNVYLNVRISEVMNVVFNSLNVWLFKCINVLKFRFMKCLNV